jgi:hypothetical protein
VFFVDPLEAAGLGNRSYLAGGRHSALVVDPPRDIDRSRQAARILAGRGTEAVDVTGGMTAWAAARLPVRNCHGAAGTVA